MNKYRKPKITYLEASLESVMRHYAKGFKSNIHCNDWFCDVGKGIVIFRLYVEEEEAQVDLPEQIE